MPHTRPKITVYIATSIDGFIAREDGGLDWLDRVGGYDNDYGFAELVGSIDGAVMGRKTYEVASTVQDWPYKGKRVIVLSKTLEAVRPDAELYSGEVEDLARKLHAEGVRHVWVDGGATIGQFLRAGLVDRMILSVIPVILGSGVSLFGRLGKEVDCKLVSAQGYPSGLVQMCYEVK